MRGKTKIVASLLGAVLVVAGVAYVGSGDKESGQVSSKDASNTTPSATEGSGTSVALANDRAGGSGSAMRTVDTGVTSTDSASPAPRRIDDSTTGRGLAGDGFRPRPAETHEPVAPMGATDVPAERSGLSVLPNLGSPSLDDVPLTSNHDLPPNTERAAEPAGPALPDIAPLNIAGPPKADSATAAGSGTAVAAGGDSTEPSAKIDLAAVDGPQPSPLAAKPAEKAKPREYVVQSGDTFSSIALKQLGSTRHVKELMKANPNKDAKRLYVGTKLILPDLPAASPTVAAGTGTSVSSETPAKPVAGTASIRTTGAVKDTFVVPPPDPARSYTVQPGEGWFELARKFMGRGEGYPRHYEYNKARVGGNPDLLRAGTVIELPPSAKMPARSAPQPSTAQPAAAPGR